MKKDNKIFLKHVIESINEIQSHLGNAEKQGFLEDKKMQDAVIRRLEIIGEAVKNLSAEFRIAHFSKKLKLKKPFGKYGFFDMDPTGFAPVSPLTKGGILLHKLQARAHIWYAKTKEALFQGPLLLVSGSPQDMQIPPYIVSIAN